MADSAKNLVQIKHAGSVYVVDTSDPTLCQAFDRDCKEVLKMGRALSCSRGEMPHGIQIESEGRCPFLGD